jgi:hypothetical protein
MTALGDLVGRCDLVWRGRQFDRFCQWFMPYDLVYARELRHVWLWDEWLGPGSTSASVTRKTWRAGAAATLGAATARRCAGSCPPRLTGVIVITADASTAATRKAALSVSAQKVPTQPRQAIDVVREHSDVGDESRDDAQYAQVIAGRNVAGCRCSTPPWRRRRMRHQPHGSVARDEGLGFVACAWRNSGETRTASLTHRRRFP